MSSLNIYRGSGASTYITVNISDRTKLSQRLLGEDFVEFFEVSNSVYDIAIGDFITLNATTYYCNQQPDVKKLGRMYEHKAIFESLQYELTRAQYLDSDNKSDFYLTGDLDDFLDLIVTNMNRALTGWSKGTVDATNKTYYHNLHFQGESCMQVLQRLVDVFEGEYEISNRAINFSDTISNASIGSLSYGKDNGLESIEKRTLSEHGLITRLYAYGSGRNLNSDYRSGQTRLEFDSGGNNYVQKNTTTYGVFEYTKIFDHIYPHFAGSVTTVSADYLSFTDVTHDFDVNSYLIGGVSAKVHFNDGDLGGYQFELWKYDSTANSVCLLQFTDETDLTLPNTTLHMATGDHYTFVDITMPTAYVSAAETLLLEAATGFLADHAEPVIHYGILPHKKYLKDNAINIQMGDAVTLTDTELSINTNTRVTRAVRQLNDPYRYTDVEVAAEVQPEFMERLYSDIRDTTVKGEAQALGDIPRYRWGWWMSKGEHTGRTWQTDSGMPGHYQRIVIDGENNKLSFYNASNVEVLYVDDNIYGSKPGLKLIDGVIYNYEDASNVTFMYSDEIQVWSNDNAAGDHRCISGNYVAVTADGGSDRVAVSGRATKVGGTDTIMGIYGSVVGGGGNAYSGYFDGGNHHIKLGDAAGSDSFRLKDSADTQILDVDSDGRIASKTISNTFLSDGAFPAKMTIIKNEEMDNTLSLASSSTITVLGINTTTNVLSVSWLPYVESIWNPTSGEEWFVRNLDVHSDGSDPSAAGNYTAAFLVTGGTYTGLALNYDVKMGAETNWSVGDKIALINPFEANWSFPTTSAVIGKAGTGWRGLYTNDGGIFKHSDGNYRMLVNGRATSGTTTFQVGAFSSSDMAAWSVLNSDQPVLTPHGTTGWRKTGIAARSIVKLPHEEGYICYCYGWNGSKWRIGSVKFDEDFTKVRYSDDEVIDSSGSSSGFYVPAVIHHGSKYRLMYVDRHAGVATSFTCMEAFCDTPDGTFGNAVTVFTSPITNEGSIYSSHASGCHYFRYQGELYAIIMGCARYRFSGTKNKNIAGLWHWNGDATSDAWDSVNLTPDAVKLPGANSPAEDTEDGFPCHRYDRGTDESVYFAWEIADNYVGGTANVQGHYDFFVTHPPSGATAEAVALGFEYKKLSEGDVFDFGSGTATGILTEAIAGGETAKILHQTMTGPCASTGWACGDHVLFRFYRAATNTLDTYDNEASGANNDVWMTQYHLEYRTNKKASPQWEEDARNPIWINVFHGNEIYGSYSWQIDHGNGGIVYMNDEDGKLYLFFTANASTDTYGVGCVTMDVQQLLGQRSS